MQIIHSNVKSFYYYLYIIIYIFLESVYVVMRTYKNLTGSISRKGLTVICDFSTTYAFK